MYIYIYESWVIIPIAIQFCLEKILPMESKHCNIAGRSVLNARSTMLKNKPHLVTFHESILSANANKFSAEYIYIYIYIYAREWVEETDKKLTCTKINWEGDWTRHNSEWVSEREREREREREWLRHRQSDSETDKWVIIHLKKKCLFDDHILLVKSSCKS